MGLLKDELGYTYCQVPVIYHLSEKDWSLNIHFTDGMVENIKGNKVSQSVSKSIFHRNGLIKEVLVEIPVKNIIF